MLALTSWMLIESRSPKINWDCGQSKYGKKKDNIGVNKVHDKIFAAPLIPAQYFHTLDLLVF